MHIPHGSCNLLALCRQGNSVCSNCRCVHKIQCRSSSNMCWDLCSLPRTHNHIQNSIPCISRAQSITHLPVYTYLPCKYQTCLECNHHYKVNINHRRSWNHNYKPNFGQTQHTCRGLNTNYQHRTCSNGTRCSRPFYIHPRIYRNDLPHTQVRTNT